MAVEAQRVPGRRRGARNLRDQAAGREPHPYRARRAGRVLEIGRVAVLRDERAARHVPELAARGDQTPGAFVAPDERRVAAVGCLPRSGAIVAEVADVQVIETMGDVGVGAARVTFQGIAPVADPDADALDAAVRADLQDAGGGDRRGRGVVRQGSVEQRAPLARAEDVDVVRDDNVRIAPLAVGDAQQVAAGLRRALPGRQRVDGLDRQQGGSEIAGAVLLDVVDAVVAESQSNSSMARYRAARMSASACVRRNLPSASSVNPCASRLASTIGSETFPVPAAASTAFTKIWSDCARRPFCPPPWSVWTSTSTGRLLSSTGRLIVRMPAVSAMSNFQHWRGRRRRRPVGMDGGSGSRGPRIRRA